MTGSAAVEQTIPRRLVGRTAIITGAGSGMGLSSVERFLAEGANVVAVDLNGDAAALAVAAAGDHGTAIEADVTDADAVQRAVDQTVERFGTVDCFFNNAGLAQKVDAVENLSEDVWRRVMDVNLTAFFYAARAVVPIMKGQGSGVILVTSSMSGIRPRPGLAAYNAAKGGANLFAKALAIELAEHQIRVNAICPTATDTPMLSEFGAGDHITSKATPLGRLARADEMAATAAFLASDDASFITGSTIMVDGGRGI